MSQFTDFFQAGGTLRTDAPSYIEREADGDLLAALEQGELCLVLAPRQTGKSSLMVHALARLEQKGICAGIVDFQGLGGKAEPEPWFGDVLFQIERTLRLKKDSQQWWEDHDYLGVSQRFASFLEDVVLAEIDKQVVIFFDEIDSALALPFSDDFFTAIRGLYNARANRPELRRLTFVLLGVATPSAFIKNPRITPFNIGRPITLNDFDREASAPFQKVLGPGSDPLIDRIFTGRMVSPGWCKSSRQQSIHGHMMSAVLGRLKTPFLGQIRGPVFEPGHLAHRALRTRDNRGRRGTACRVVLRPSHPFERKGHGTPCPSI